MNKKIIAAATVAALAALLVFGPSLLAKDEKPARAGPGRKAAAASSDTVYSVKAEKAVRLDLQAYSELNGNIETETSVDVLPDAGGKIVSLKVDIGSTVRKGDLVAEVDPSKPGSQYSLSPVYSPIAGTVVASPLDVGATVSTATTILTVGVMDRLQVVANVSERDVGQLKAGLRAEIALQAFPGEKFDASVERVAPVVDPDTRTKEIILKFAKNDPRINTGMFARIKLNTQLYEDRLVVPEEAIVALRGKSYVYVVNGETVAQRRIETGVTVDNLTEITSGIQEGDSVVTQGQQLLSDGSKVRVIGGSKA